MLLTADKDKESRFWKRGSWAQKGVEDRKKEIADRVQIGL